MPKHYNFYIHFPLPSPWTVVTDVINKLFDIFPNTVHIMLNIEPQIENIVLNLNGYSCLNIQN